MLSAPRSLKNSLLQQSCFRAGLGPAHLARHQGRQLLPPQTLLKMRFLACVSQGPICSHGDFFKQQGLAMVHCPARPALQPDMLNSNQGRRLHLLAEVVQEGGHELLLLQLAGLELRARLAGGKQRTRRVARILRIRCICLCTPTISSQPACGACNGRGNDGRHQSDEGIDRLALAHRRI
jgi:hypothetical protein